MKQIKAFQKAYNELTQAFAIKYYGKDAYIENELENEEYWLHPIIISDDVWDIQDIYQAMMLNYSKEIVRNYYEFSYNDYQKNGKITMNLYHYNLANKGTPNTTNS